MTHIQLLKTTKTYIHKRLQRIRFIEEFYRRWRECSIRLPLLNIDGKLVHELTTEIEDIYSKK